MKYHKKKRQPEQQPDAPVPKLAEKGRLSRATIIYFTLALVLAGVPFVLGKYMELNTPGAFDSAAYTYSARHILEGAKLGVDETPSARLGTLFMNIIGVAVFGFNDVGPKVVQGLLQLGALVLMFYTVRRAFGSLAGLFAVVTAAVYLSAPVIAKYGNVKEQFMISFMVAGVCFCVLHRLSGKWWMLALSGAIAAWAPLFKETGVSCIAAIGLYTITRPLLEKQPVKIMLRNIGLLLAGGIASLAPVYLWIIFLDVNTPLPYEFILKPLGSIQIPMAFSIPLAAAGSYITGARRLFGFSEQAPIVGRYYMILIMPITFALASIITRIVRFMLKIKSKLKNPHPHESLVLLFAVWWLLDMAFVWISPRSYEQYYLPLNASAAMLGSYVVGLYARRFHEAQNKMPWLGIGAFGAVAIVSMSWHIFAGITYSPHWGTRYKDPYGNLERRRGYVQRLKEARQLASGDITYPWMAAGDYIREHSKPEDKIYVWGWIPGIYVQAERLSPHAKAVEGNMHVYEPDYLEWVAYTILKSLKKDPPKFIVDTRKNHFPWTSPPLELWPILQKGMLGVEHPTPLPNDPRYIEAYEKFWTVYLSEKVSPEEAKRFEAMSPFREFVMNNYKPVMKNFGSHMVFELKQDR